MNFRWEKITKTNSYAEVLSSLHFASAIEPVKKLSKDPAPFACKSKTNKYL